MQEAKENKKIILGEGKTEGYEIKKVLKMLDKNDDAIEVYASKDTYNFFINSSQREQESLMSSFSGEADKILEEIEAIEDIDTQLFGLHCTLEYAENLSYEQMREQIQKAMQHINALRANNRENTQSKLNELNAGQQCKPLEAKHQEPQTNELRKFEYQPHESLIDNASKQLSEFYNIPFKEAKETIEEARKEAVIHPL